MANRFGDILYKDIEKNYYLNELYQNILCNYSLSLFNNMKTTRKPLNVNHALCFADILSKSIHPQNAEKHKIWAQEIVALLNALYPNNSSISYYIGSVLTNAGNYRGLKQYESAYIGSNILEQSYNEYIRNMLRIPADPQHHFLNHKEWCMIT